MREIHTDSIVSVNKDRLSDNFDERQYLIDYMGIKDIWRLFRIMAEFSESFEVMGNMPDAVSVFGSARTPESHPMYQQARQLGKRIAQEGFATITGGGPGIMEAVNRGAYEENGISIGMNIELPLEQKPNDYLTTQLDFRYFFIRKVMLVKYSVAFVIFPGGFGTLDELFEALTLIQTRRMRPFPVILYCKDYWEGMMNWIRDKLLVETNISKDDLTLLTVTDSIEEVIERVKGSDLIGRQQNTSASGVENA
ncbi:MAG: TIGR00730 family Rossman fold protein [bacterium]|jgi:uncharacterized protein (TIGR00730 family)